MAHKLLDGATAVGASKGLKLAKSCAHHTVQVQFKDYGVTPVTSLVVELQGSLTGANSVTGILSNPALAIGSTPEQVANGAFNYRINNVNYSKTAVAAGTALGTGYAVTTAKYGVVIMVINAAGTISYKFPATTQAYTTAALAMAAGDDLVSSLSVDLCYMGRVLLYNNTGSEWNSQTDDLTDASDITNAVFMNANLEWYTMNSITFDAENLANQGVIVYSGDTELFAARQCRWVRLYLSTLTGDGIVDAWYEGCV